METRYIIIMRGTIRKRLFERVTVGSLSDGINLLQFVDNTLFFANLHIKVS